MYKLPVMSRSDYKSFNVVLSLCSSYYVTCFLLIGSLAIIQSVSAHLVRGKGSKNKSDECLNAFNFITLLQEIRLQRNIYFTCNSYYTLPTTIDKRISKIANLF